MLKKKETTGVLSNRHRIGQPKETRAVAVKNNPKISVSDITNNHDRAGVKISQSTVLESSNIVAIPQDANHSSVVRIRRQDYNLQRCTEMSQKGSGSFMN